MQAATLPVVVDPGRAIFEECLRKRIDSEAPDYVGIHP
jgi:hypothetical protein